MTLHTKYRPSKFSEVVGQDPVVRSLKGVLAKGHSRAFLFTGPSGTGKTTLARIVAAEAGCAPADIRAGEHDAATNTGIDAMRAIQDMLEYRPIGGTASALIIDECHALSRQAWQSLLKALEEPPEWGWWFLCTTEPTRVPAAAVTRCVRYDLKPVAQATLLELLERVADDERLKLGEDAGRILTLCAREAAGSPRQALVNLAACAAARSVAEARDLLRSAEERREAVELARALVRGAKWVEVQAILKDLTEVSAESIRHVVRDYATKVVLGANTEKAAAHGMSILDAFSVPCSPQDGLSPIVLACGHVVLGE